MKEEKYLQNKLELIRGSIAGVLLGSLAVAEQGKKVNVHDMTNICMNMVEKDVRNIFKYAKKLNYNDTKSTK